MLQCHAEIQCRPAWRHLPDVFPVAHFAVIAVTALRALITCLAIVEKDLHDAIGAKLALGRAHPVAGSHHSYRMGSAKRQFRADVPTSLKRVHAPTTPGSVVLLG